MPRIVEPEHDRSGPLPREIADLRIVPVDDEHGLSGQTPARRRRQRSATCSNSPYRSSWSLNRFPRQTARGRTRSAISGSAASSTSNSPSSGLFADRRLDVTPESRFAPDELYASRTRGDRISAAIAAVVVLPFVAETSAEPSGRRRARRSSTSGSIDASTLPGTVVPPPAPTSRESRAATRAPAIPTVRGTRTLTAGGYPGRGPSLRGGILRPSPQRVIRRFRPEPTVKTSFTCGQLRLRAPTGA